MNWLEQLKSASLIEPLGWTILHSFWQGAAIALLTAIALRIARSGSAQIRYLIACVALFAMLVVAVGTFVKLRVTEVPTLITTKASITSAAPSIQPIQISESATAFHPVASSLTERIRPILPSLSLAWIAGVLLLGAYHAGGWMLLRRLRGQSKRIVDASCRSMLNDLIVAMRINRTVQLCESAMVQVPTAIGWISPMILLPTSAIVGLSPSELRGLLAHELAHIRRHDYLVNLLQTVIETLLFYHPATWWLSKVIRQERENCCDDFAAAVCDRTIYAQALATMESLRQSPQLALSVKGAALLPRIRRILGLPTSTNRRSLSSGLVSVSILVAVIAGGILLNACRSNTKAPTTQLLPATEPQTASADNVTFHIESKRIWSSGPNDDDLKPTTRPVSQTATYMIGGFVGRQGEFGILGSDFRLLNALERSLGTTSSARTVAIFRGDSESMRIIYIPLEQLRSDPDHFNVVITSGDRIWVGQAAMEAGRADNHSGSSSSKSAPYLQGRITEAATGKPVPNVTVKIYGGMATRWLMGSTTTNADGRYHFDNLSEAFMAVKTPGHWVGFTALEIDHPSLCSADGQSWWDVTLPWDGKSATKDFKLVPGGKLYGTVNNQIGKGNANVPLRIYTKDNQFLVYATTDERGQFTTAPLYPGDYVIDVNRPSANYPQLAIAEVKAGENSPLELHYDPPTATTEPTDIDISQRADRAVYQRLLLKRAQEQQQLQAVKASGGEGDSEYVKLQQELDEMQNEIASVQTHLAERQYALLATTQPTTAPTINQSMDVTRVQLSQTRSRIEATQMDLLRAKRELAEDDPKIAELQKLLAQRDASLAILTKRMAEQDAAEQPENSPATQPSNQDVNYYYVSGVLRSGVYSLGQRPITLKQALVSAGINDSMRSKTLSVVHKDGSHQSYKVSDILDGDQGKILSRPDDVLMVVDSVVSAEYYINGDIPRIGVYSIPDGHSVNVLQAIISAGGDPNKIGNDTVAVRSRAPIGQKVNSCTVNQLITEPSRNIALQPNDQILLIDPKSVASNPAAAATTRP